MRALPRVLPLLPVILALPFAACGGSDSTPKTTGSVYVVVDTATGSDALVQYEVGAAVFEYADGSTTPNVLRESTTVTFASPSGETDGFALRNVPSGDFRVLHLMVVPNSGAALQPGSGLLPLQSELDIVVRLPDGLRHNELADTWLVIGHDSAGPAAGTSPDDWTPTMSARGDDTLVELDGLRVANVEGQDVAVLCGVADDGVLRLEFAAQCAFSADGQTATRDTFMHDLRSNDLRAELALGRDGRALVHHVDRRRGLDHPLLIGRITAIDTATEHFDLAVFAMVRRFGIRIVWPPITVRVNASDSVLRRLNRDPIAFADLQVGLLAGVAWTERIQTDGEPDLFDASVVTVTAFPAPLHPVWAGSVQSVDVAANTLVVVPIPNIPIVIDGVSVPQATLSVDDDTIIFRRNLFWPFFSAVELADIEAGDLVAWRGTVTGPEAIDVAWLGVRHL